VAALVVAYLAGYLVNVPPILGGIGILDAGLVGALVLYGLPLPQATAAVLVYHAVAFWISSLGGMLAYARLRPRLSSLAQSQPRSRLRSAHNPTGRGFEARHALRWILLPDTKCTRFGTTEVPMRLRAGADKPRPSV
jgi:hypothetical protein